MNGQRNPNGAKSKNASNHPVPRSTRASSSRTPWSTIIAQESAPSPGVSTPQEPHTPGTLGGAAEGRTGVNGHAGEPTARDGTAAATVPEVVETPWIGPDDPSAKWYRTAQVPKKKRGHPYELQAAVMQATGKNNVVAYDVKFWSWVGPYRPSVDPPVGSWDDWEDCLVICAGPRILVARCTDEKPFDLLWTLEFPGLIFRAEWTFDVFTRRPLIVCGGREGIIYVVDAISKTVTKTFVGHGDEILCISICRGNPHIFATASGDKTTRIWNIRGAGPPDVPPHRFRSENYPMGDAEEGTECVAILAGEGYGHLSKVICCTFHPRHCAIATSGGDHHVKIWALPPLPMPERKPTPTPLGYRPKLIMFPVFSTSRMHIGPVDWIEWISSDVLVSRDPQYLTLWHWLGYARFFTAKRWLPLSTHAQHEDMHDSHSYADLTWYPVPNGEKKYFWFKTPSLHRAFIPADDEEDKYEGSNLVTDCLIAMPGNDRHPGLLLMNPSLAKDDHPDPIPYLRPKSETDPWSELAPGVAEENARKAREKAEKAGQAGQGDAEDPGEDSDGYNRPNRKSAGVGKGKGKKRAQEDAEEMNESLTPWALKVKDWKTLEKFSPAAKRIVTSQSVVWATAISPRGAKWVVGVGEVETVFVFRQKDKGEAG